MITIDDMREMLEEIGSAARTREVFFCNSRKKRLRFRPKCVIMLKMGDC